jgi:hypothetical protein
MSLLSAGVALAANESAGREQLVQAFDAGWVRYVESGQYEADIAAFSLAGVPGGPSIPASDYVINQSDCLPQPENVEFPDNPKGLLKDILDNGSIRRGFPFGFSPFPGASTADYFAPLNEAMLAGIMAEIESHYNVSINVVDVVIGVPFNTTSALLDGVFNNPHLPFPTPPDDLNPVHFIGQFNALGGETEGARRRDTRRFTCAMSSSGQYIHLTAGVAGGIDSLADLRAATIADPTLNICTGPLSTQTIRSYLPEANANGQIYTENLADIAGCVTRVGNGDSQVYVNSLPQLPNYAAPSFSKTVFTKIVAGTPYWVAKEGVACTRSPFAPFASSCGLAGNN